MSPLFLKPLARLTLTFADIPCDLPRRGGCVEVDSSGSLAERDVEPESFAYPGDA